MNLIKNRLENKMHTNRVQVFFVVTIDVKDLCIFIDIVCIFR